MDNRLQQTVAELNHFLDEHFPQADHYGEVVSISDKTALMRMDITDSHLRPGGTVSGPTLMAMADLAMYVVILAQIGPVALAVTTNLNINFLRKPIAGKAVTAEATLLTPGPLKTANYSATPYLCTHGPTELIVLLMHPHIN